MKNYTKPTAEVVELSVKESLSALKKATNKKTFGFGGDGEKTIGLTTYAEANTSRVIG